MKLKTRESRLRCAVCHEALERVERSCPSCATTLHSECAEDLARCPTFGCAGRPIPERRWLRVAVVFNAAAVFFAASVIGLSRSERGASAPRPRAETPLPASRPAEPARQAPRRLPGGVSTADIRSECLGLMQDKRHVFTHDDLRQLPPNVLALSPTIVTADADAVSIESPERAFYVFSVGSSPAMRVGSWTNLGDGVWELGESPSPQLRTR